MCVCFSFYFSFFDIGLFLNLLLLFLELYCLMRDCWLPGKKQVWLFGHCNLWLTTLLTAFACSFFFFFVVIVFGVFFL